jgi:hypothetical protein
MGELKNSIVLAGEVHEKDAERPWVQGLRPCRGAGAEPRHGRGRQPALDLFGFLVRAQAASWVSFSADAWCAQSTAVSRSRPAGLTL